MPEILPYAEWLWEAWEDLTSKRVWREGLADPIQASEILAYAEFHEVPKGVLREDLYYIISSLDSVLLLFVREQKKRREGKERRRKASGLGRKRL